MVSIRPAILLAISTSVASMRPLLTAKPSGTPAGRNSHHATIAATASNPTTHHARWRLLLSIIDPP